MQITESLRSTAITAVSSLLRILPQLNLASLLSSLSCQRLDFSLVIKVQLSPVPYKSLYRDPAAFTPTAIRSINRHPPDFVPVVAKSSGFDCNKPINDASRAIHFRSASRCTPDCYRSLFHTRSAPQLLVAAPNGGLKPAPVCRLRRAHPHLLQSTSDCDVILFFAQSFFQDTLSLMGI